MEKLQKQVEYLNRQFEDTLQELIRMSDDLYSKEQMIKKLDQMIKELERELQFYRTFKSTNAYKSVNPKWENSHYGKRKKGDVVENYHFTRV
jgi:restriction endonuclease S subunit